MDSLANWFSTHWQNLAIAIGGLVGCLLTIIIILGALYGVMQMLIKLSKSRLDQAKITSEASRLREDDTGQLDALRRELRSTQSKLADVTTISDKQQKLLTAQEENLSARALEIARVTTESKRAHEAASKLAEVTKRAWESQLSDARSELASLRQHVLTHQETHLGVAQQLEAVTIERDNLSQACGMIERQMKGLESNVAMQQSTVTDLNAKRDLMTAEIGHLKERLAQETSLRETLTARNNV